MKYTVCQAMAATYPASVFLKTNSQYRREREQNGERLLLFMAWFSLRESLLAACGSLPVVIACYQPSDTQTWEVLQGSPTHKHCRGYGFRFTNLCGQWQRGQEAYLQR